MKWGGTKPEFFFRCKKFSEMPKKINSGLRPENKGGPKIEKKVVFWHKKCEKFQTRHPIFFSQKIFNPPMRPKRHFALKDTFPMETIVNKKTAKIPKILLSYFSKKKIENKIKLDFFSLGACGASASFFFPAPAAPLFFFFFQQENPFP